MLPDDGGGRGSEGCLVPPFYRQGPEKDDIVKGDDQQNDEQSTVADRFSWVFARLEITMIVFPPGAEQGKEFFNYVQGASITFSRMVQCVSAKTRVEYHFADVETSFWDSGRGHIVISVRNPGHLVESDIIFEFCNAYNSLQHGEPMASQYRHRVEFYGAMKERFEWKSVKLHVDVLSEVQRFDPQSQYRNWPLINRFAPAFAKGPKSWVNFQNYYQEQRLSGHTRKITSHHPDHRYVPTTVIPLAAEPPRKKRRIS